MGTVEIIKNHSNKFFILLDYIGDSLVKVVTPKAEIKNIQMEIFPDIDDVEEISLEEAREYAISNAQVEIATKYEAEQRAIMERIEEQKKKFASIFEESKEEAKKGENKGELFEREVSKCLVELGCKVVGNIEPTETYREEIKKVLTQFVTEGEEFKKVRDIDNIHSISGDFLSDNISISCKRRNAVVKHPKLGRIFSMIMEKDICEMIDMEGFSSDFFNKRLLKDEFCDLEGSMSEVASRIANKMKSLLPEKVECENKVKEVYQFLMGKDKPVIITETAKGIMVVDTRDIEDPTNFTIDKSSKKVVLHFDNGISLEHRIKWGINSKTQALWTRAYKEEWKKIS